MVIMQMGPQRGKCLPHDVRCTRQGHGKLANHQGQKDAAHGKTGGAPRSHAQLGLVLRIMAGFSFLALALAFLKFCFVF